MYMYYKGVQITDLVVYKLMENQEVLGFRKSMKRPSDTSALLSVNVTLVFNDDLILSENVMKVNHFYN